MGKKYRCFFMVFVCLVLGFGSCKEKESEERKSVYEVMTQYEPENRQTYTIDEEGNLYTVELVIGDEEGAGYYLRKYDKEGNRLFSKPCDTLFGYTCTNFGAMAVKDGILYITPCRWVDETFYQDQDIDQMSPDPETGGVTVTEEMQEYLEGNRVEGAIRCSVLFSYDLVSETVTKIREFSCFKQVLRILIGEEHIYLLGKDNTEPGIAKRSAEDYVSYGEKIVRYTPSTKEEVTLGIAEPIDIALNGEGDLLIHANMEEGFRLLLYNAEMEAVKVLNNTDGTGMFYFAYSTEEDSLLYIPSTDAGVVCAKLTDLSDVCGETG